MKSLLTGLITSIALVGFAQAKPTIEKPLTMAEATSGPSQVAIWKTGDKDTTVYLMGTVHILNPGINWKNDAIRAAWDASSVVFFEADVTSPAAMNEVAALIPAFGFNPPDITFSSFYTNKEIELINTSLAGLGLDIDMLAPLRPWLAGLQVSNLAISSIGGSPDAGIEMILSAQAEEEGKEKRYFESLSDQINILATGDDDDHARMFLEGIEDLKNPERFFAKLVGAWYKGNEKDLANILTDSMQSAPEIADALLYQRNQKWAATLNDLIEDEDGVFFVAVGAGHLVGEKSVQDYLKLKGHVSKQLN